MALARCILVSIFVLAFSGIVSAANYQQQPEEDITGFKVQGLIYCRENGKLIPLPGAMARITCTAEDDESNEGQFSVVSRNTDNNGYYLINLARFDLDAFTLSKCKVYLENHPPGICNIPTDVNGGLSGASLLSYRTLRDSSRLYSVPAFVYDAQVY